MNFTITSLLGAVATAALLAGNADAEPIRIGFLGDMAGPVADLAPAIEDGAKLALQHVNDQGGLLGGNDAVLIAADAGCANAAKAASAANRLVEIEKVVAVVGALCSAATISAARNAAVPGDVAIISPSATSPLISGLDDKDLLFRTVASDAYQGEVLSRLIAGEGVARIVMAFVNNDYGKVIADSISATFAAGGGTVAAAIAYDEGKADYSTELDRLADTGATDLVVIGYASGSGGIFLRQALETGDFERFYAADGLASDSLAEEFGGALDGKLVMTKPGTPEIPGSESFMKLAADAGIRGDGVFVANAYDAAFLLALAIEQAASTDRSKVAAALRDVSSPPGEVILPGEWSKARYAIRTGRRVNYEGASGTVDFDANGDVSRLFMKAEFRDGKLVESGIAE
jgi:branched-chain amino acid transport system substrate-binding protein